jgi:DNA-binding MarR family transcriptional regulator
VPLTPPEIAVLDALRYCANGAGIVRAVAVADVAGLSRCYTSSLLKSLEIRGLVDRPRGPKSGWRPVLREVLRLVM